MNFRPWHRAWFRRLRADDPPFNSPLRQNASPDPAAVRRIWRRSARSANGGGSGVGFAFRRTLTLIWRADGLAEVLAALDGRFGNVAVLPITAAPERRRFALWWARGKRQPCTLALLRD